MPDLPTFITELENSLTMVPSGSLSPDTRFREEPWWDSLALLGILAVFDGCFDFQIEPEAVRTCETVRDLYDLGASRQNT